MKTERRPFSEIIVDICIFLACIGMLAAAVLFFVSVCKLRVAISESTPTPSVSADMDIPDPISSEEPDPLLYFDVPLDEHLQEHIFIVCENYDIDPAIVLAMIERESRFRTDVIGDNGNSFGLMQIQPKWHKDRMNELGVTDLMDPYQNVIVGIDYIAELFGRSEDVTWVLMAYNGGPSYANKWYGQGVVSTYAKEVIARAEELNANRIEK